MNTRDQLTEFLVPLLGRGASTRKPQDHHPLTVGRPAGGTLLQVRRAGQVAWDAVRQLEEEDVHAPVPVGDERDLIAHRRGLARVVVGLGKIMEDLRPESVYFTEQDGKRGCVCVVEVTSPSDIPKYAEPFFLHFNAECRFRVAMSPEDLKKAGLEDLGKKWS